MRCLVTGSGGFIGGHLTAYLVAKCDQVRAVDIKPVPQWYQLPNELLAAPVCLDLTDPANCSRMCEDVEEVYQLAADMGGIGYIETERVACMRNAIINANMLKAAHCAGVRRYFFSSSACVYNTDLQQLPGVTALKESDAYPAMSERGYGWEKLYAEMLCQEYWAERGLETHIARFHNVYGSMGSYNDGREKAPAALCRKVAEAKLIGKTSIDIWGDGTQTRSYMWIGDCVKGIDKIMHCPDLIATPINLGSSELISVTDLARLIESIAGVTLDHNYQPDAPKGVAGRNSDNTLIKKVLGWEPSTPLREGLTKTYQWISANCKSQTGPAKDYCHLPGVCVDKIPN